MTGETPETSAREDFAAALEVETPAVETVETVEQVADNPIPAELPPLEAPTVWGKQYKETFS